MKGFIKNNWRPISPLVAIESQSLFGNLRRKQKIDAFKDILNKNELK